MSHSTNSLWDRLPEPVRRDPKKSSVLAALTLLMAVLGVRQFSGNGTPAKARAASNDPVAAPEKPKLSISANSREASNAGTEVAHRVALWLGTPIKALDRNLFETKLEYFQRLDSTAADKATVVADETFWDQLAKSLVSQADQKRQKQIRSENLQLAASSLKLQTTIMGSMPKALIDGRMVRVGDTVDTKTSSLSISFRVSQIEARRIVIEHEDVRIELRMGTGQARVITE
jgi:hypothetical protein